MKEIKKVAIIGLGAVGTMYCQLLTNAYGKENVYVVADEARLARYRSEGVYSNGELMDYNYKAVSEAKDTDLLIFATKQTGLDAAIETVRPMINDELIVMSFLNGITSEDYILQKLPVKHMLYTTVQGMNATKEGNKLTYDQSGTVAFGLKDGEKYATEEDYRAVEALLKNANMAYTLPEDVLHQQWSKWMLNVGLNQACACYATGYRGVKAEGDARNDMIAAMYEARACAAAEGIDLTEKELRDWVALSDSLASDSDETDGMPSMRQDTKAGRKTEVELFSGTVIKLAKKHGIDVPVNEKFYSILTSM